MWPFRRRARGAEEVPQQDAGPVLRAPRQDWKALAPMPTVQSRPLATVDAGFEQGLATRQAPTFLGPLGHHLVPEAPHGRVAAASTPMAFSPAPRVQRHVMTFADPPAAPRSQPVAVSPEPADPDVPVVPADVEAGPLDLAAPATPDVPAAVRAAPVVSRLVTAPPPREFPTVPFPVVARLPVAEVPSAAEDVAATPPDVTGAADRPAGGAPDEVVDEAADDDALASLVGDKPPITSLPEPGRPASSVAPTPPASPGPRVQREAHAPARPAGTASSGRSAPTSTAGGTRSGSRDAAQVSRSTTVPASPAQAGAAPPTVARTLDPTGSPRPRVVPRIGQPIQRTPEGAPPPASEAVAAPAASEPSAPPAIAPPPAPAPAPAVPVETAPAEVHRAEPWIDVDAGVESLPLIGDRGLRGAPASASSAASTALAGSPGPTVARSPRPDGGPTTSPAAGPAVTAQRAVTWRPRVGEPFAPASLGSTPSVAPASVTGRPTVSRHAAGGPGHDHGADDWPEVSTLAVSRLAAAPAPHVLASGSVARAPEPDARTVTRHETTAAGIRWSDRPAPVASPWSTSAVQRSSTRPSAPPPRMPPGASPSRTPTASIAQLSMQNEGSVRSPSRVEEQVWWELPGAADVVQRQADEAVPEPAPTAAPPEANTVTATAETEPAAPTGPGAAGGERKAPTAAEADDWARALYPALRRRICRDLLLDRERSGYSTDIRF